MYSFVRGRQYTLVVVIQEIKQVARPIPAAKPTGYFAGGTRAVFFSSRIGLRRYCYCASPLQSNGVLHANKNSAHCAPSRDRTCDRLLKRQLLYRLSYRGTLG